MTSLCVDQAPSHELEIRRPIRFGASTAKIDVAGRRARWSTTPRHDSPLDDPTKPIHGRSEGSFLCQRGLHQRTVDGLPPPGNALHVVALGQPGLLQGLEEAGLLPIEEARVNCTGVAKAHGGQGIPLTAREQNIHDALEHLPCGLRQAPGIKPTHVLFVQQRHPLRNQWLHALPERNLSPPMIGFAWPNLCGAALPAARLDSLTIYG